jgi:hypothetical protein
MCYHLSKLLYTFDNLGREASRINKNNDNNNSRSTSKEILITVNTI